MIKRAVVTDTTPSAVSGRQAHLVKAGEALTEDEVANWEDRGKQVPDLLKIELDKEEESSEASGDVNLS